MDASPSKAPGLPLLLIGLPVVGVLLLVGMAMCIALLASGSAAGCESTPTGGSARGVPKKLVPIYQEAAAKYRLGPKGPSVLAGINFEESTFGTNMATSSAGANGWMAFLPSSWEVFGVDANGDGTRDPYNPWDAIFAAARLLRYSGAPDNWHDAIYSYNHAEWYVEDVLADARKWAGIGSIEATAASCEGGAPNERVARMLAAAYREAKKKLGYIWGGFDPHTGFDCSGGVSWVLGIGKFMAGRTDTQGLAVWGEPGPGHWITVYIKTTGDPTEEHTTIEISGVLFESGGGDENENPNGGWGKVDPSQAKDFLSQFDTKRHPPGF